MGDIINVSVDVTNTGDMEADEVVQLYIRDLVASLTQPVKELKGFSRIHLKPQETKTVIFDLSTNNLGFHNSEGKYIVEPGKFDIWVGPGSDTGLKSEFEIIE